MPIRAISRWSGSIGLKMPLSNAVRQEALGALVERMQLGADERSENVFRFAAHIHRSDAREVVVAGGIVEKALEKELQLGDRGERFRGDARHQRDQILDDPHLHGPQQLFLGGEVVVDHGAGDPGLGADVADARPAEALRRKEGFRAVENQLAGVFFSVLIEMLHGQLPN